MENKEIEKTKKSAKKVTKKRVAKPSEPKLNETVTIKKEEKTINHEIKHDENQKECMYCHKRFDKGMTICPHCRKRQKDNTFIVVTLVLALVFIIVIIGSHFLNKYNAPVESASEYKKECSLVAYENLVRYANQYKGKDIKIFGKVLYVNGFDEGYANNMTITINSNLFNDGSEQTVEIEYEDKNYDHGLLEGDVITVYGKYKEINGNIPTIKAKYIVFGQESA